MNPSRRSKIIDMNSIITRALLSLLITLGGVALFYLLNRTKPKKPLFQFDATEWQAKRAERKARLESRSILTRAETEELRIIQSVDDHDEAIRNGYRMDIISVTSPKIKEKQQKRHEELVKRNPLFKNAPPAPPFLYRSPNVQRIELESRSRAAADVGTAFVFYNTGSNYDSDVQASYVMVRTPERWTAFDVIYQRDEDLLSIIQQHCNATTLIQPPKGPIVERVWKPISKTWA